VAVLLGLTSQLQHVDGAELRAQASGPPPYPSQRAADVAAAPPALGPWCWFAPLKVNPFFTSPSYPDGALITPSSTLRLTASPPWASCCT
jgi:hypothetical protein